MKQGITAYSNGASVACNPFLGKHYSKMLEVAQPGAKLCNPKLALTRVARINDPTGVSIAGRGVGRIPMVEPVGRVNWLRPMARCFPNPSSS
jgi:hypothetical protein